VKELVKLLEKANKAYREGNPIITDAEYDAYIEELKNLDPNHPYLNKVEEESFEKPKIKHTEPMLSIEKVFSIEDLGKWFKRIEKNYNDVAYKVTPKLDGMAAKYENDILSTRGDGYEGFDITDAIKKGLVMEQGNYPLGEIVMNKDYFNENLSEKYAHPRNVVVGAIKCDNLSKDQEVSIQTGSIKFVAYDRLPLFIGRSDIILNNFSEIIQDLTEKTPYPIDGFVISVINKDIRKELGNTNHHYRWNVAYKEQTDIKQTRVYSISWQVGRGGHITPVLEVNPVKLSGAMVSRVTGHNLKYIEDRQITIGTTIEIIRSGEVIPKVVNVIDGQGAPVPPETCPVCGTKTISDDTFLICDNKNCDSQLVNKMVHFFKTLDIKGFGKKTCEKLVDNGIYNVVDVYKLQTGGFINIGFGKGQSRNLINELNNSLFSKTYPEWKLLAAIGIPSLGKGDSKKILERHTFSSIVELTPGEISNIDGFGERKSDQIVNGLISNMELFDFINENFEFEDKQEAEMTHSDLEGVHVVFTGKSSLPRKELSKLAEKYLMVPQSSITKATNYLVTGDPSTIGKTKLDKAEKFDVKVISEDEFFEMIKE